MQYLGPVQRETIDINTFKRDSSFYGELRLLTTIKNFDLQAIRARYLASKQSKHARTGSVERRAPALGGIMEFCLESGHSEMPIVHTELKEPRGIAQHGELLAISSENTVYLIDEKGIRSIQDPWFSYIHTVDFSSDGRHILVSSSGFDVILEYDVASLKRSREWWAWEHGFDQGIDPETGAAVTLSRTERVGIDNLKVIADPLKDSLPTAMRAAFINSVEYAAGKDDTFIATFFHEGAVFAIDMPGGQSEALIQGMKNPHGGMTHDGLNMATSTRTGEVILQKEGIERAYSFKALPGKPAELDGESWLQNSKLLSDGSIITIDSNRTSWVIFHPEKELIDIIPYSDNLAVQDLVVIEGESNWAEGLGSI